MRRLMSEPPPLAKNSPRVYLSDLTARAYAYFLHNGEPPACIPLTENVKGVMAYFDGNDLTGDQVYSAFRSEFEQMSQAKLRKAWAQSEDWPR